MPKSFTAGNGNILVGFDDDANLRDFYFPHVGQENHVGGNLRHRVAVRVDNKTHFLSDDFDITTRCAADTLAGEVTAKNEQIGITLHFKDVVYNEKNILIRAVEIENEQKTAREITIFFCHEFQVSRTTSANTAYYDPRRDVIIHYRGNRAFLINTFDNNGSFDDFTTGIYGLGGKEGSYMDAVDGKLEKNPIEHGPADSCISVTRTIGSSKQHTLHYWIAAGTSIEEVFALDEYTLNKGPAHLVQSTQDYWQAWLTRRYFNFSGLSSEMRRLFRRSLLILRSHVGANGAIIASSDSDMLQQGKDTYSYVWPRDASYSAMALDNSGDWNIAQRFFQFTNDVITGDGYLMHKYSPDKSLGSSWHPWLSDGEFQLPIQEDETGVVLHALWEHYQKSRDLEFIEKLYYSLLRKAADFLANYRNEETGLPKESYDLWEERMGIHTYTAASVYGGLRAAANFARLLGKADDVRQSERAANEIKEGMLEHLVVDGRFARSGKYKDGSLELDDIADMSTIFGLLEFNVLNLDHDLVKKTAQFVFDKLSVDTSVGGYARYEQDSYYRHSHHSEVVGNPWFITTLWHARFQIAKAESREDLQEAYDDLEWVVNHARGSGVLSEQVDPHDGSQISAAPLVWSHATYIRTILAYQKKYQELDNEG